MSYKATNWAYDMPISGPQKAVLVALADMADEAGTCFPGHERISGMTGWSVSTVARALKALEERGLLAREHRQGAFGYRTSDRYRLQMTVSLPESLPVTEPTRQRSFKAESESLPVTESIPTGQSDGAIEPPEEPLDEPSGKNLASIEAAPDWFEIVWAEWPKKDDKKDARARWPKAVKESHLSPSALADKAIQHADAYRSYRTRQMTPAFVVWLNKARWDNEPVGPYDRQAGKPTRTDENVAYVSSLYEQQQMEIGQ